MYPFEVNGLFNTILYLDYLKNLSTNGIIHFYTVINWTGEADCFIW